MTDYRIVPAREQQIERIATGDAYRNALLQLRESLIQGDWTIADFEAWLELKVSRCRSSRDCCAADCSDPATTSSDYCAKHQLDPTVGSYYDFGILLNQLPRLTRRTVDLVGFIPMAAILMAQATGDDRIWLGCNLLFLVYHATFTKLRTQLLCSLILTGICLYRIWSHS